MSAGRLLRALMLLPAACEDSRIRVQVAFEPPLRASVPPTEVAIAMDGDVHFEVTVSGNADGPRSLWSCDTSNPRVTRAEVVPTGCRALALARGNPTISATVTGSGETASATSRLTVNPESAQGLTHLDGTASMRGAHEDW